MQKWYSATHAGKLLNVATATILGLIDDGLLEAVNIARKSSVRKRWRISDQAISDFQERRASKPAAVPESKSSRRTIQRPVKDFFAQTGEVSR